MVSQKLSAPVLRSTRIPVFLIALVWALSFPSAANAQGGFGGLGRYQITNVKSGKVLVLDRDDQAKVIQLSAKGNDNEVWEIRSTGEGFYSIRNMMNGTALDAAGGKNSTPIRAVNFDGRTSQLWRIDAGKDDSALIVSRLGKTLEIPGGTSADGAQAQIRDGNGDRNQRFTLRLSSAANSNAQSQAIRAPQPDGRTPLKPGWNMFSPEQDVELGLQASGEVTQQVLLLNDSRVDNYLDNLGQRLAAQAPGYNYPYTFKAVNDQGINAFALPGGSLYINRGVIEAADTESQLAGVMAHEISHVALRHGTNQASKSSVAQMPLAILGGLLGQDSTGAALAQLGAGFTVNSILLKYSRDAESQADIMGTQILFDAGLDPRAMGQFFQKIQGGSGSAFFSDHPNPDRRIENVNEEATRLGKFQRTANSSQEFDQIKRYVHSLPAPRPDQLQAQQLRNSPVQPGGNSGQALTFENNVLQIDHPSSWQAYGQGDAVTITPNGGLVDDGNGRQALVYGLLVNVYEPHVDSNGYGRQLQGPGYGQGSIIPVEEATDQLVQQLRLSNTNMRIVRNHERIDVNGQSGLSTYLTNDSPAQGGGRETNWLVTMPRPEGLLFFVFTAPEREFQSFERTFQQMLYSVRLSR